MNIEPRNFAPPGGALEQLGRRVRLERPIRTARHDLLLLAGVEHILAAIQRDVERARRRLHVETYIFRDDKLGRMFAESMLEAARRGLDVRLLYDPLGSEEASVGFFDELRERGLHVRAYRPKELLLRGGGLWPRDHSRVILIDDHAYTGGAAWGDEWLPAELGGKGWHDVCLQLAGPVVSDFTRLFEQRWREASAEIAPPCDFETGDKHPDLELLADAPERRCIVYQRHVDAIRAARSRVWFEHAYFFPPPAMLKAFYDAADRGVDVQIVVPADSDLKIMERAARAEHALWIARGIQIFEYEPTMVHSKYAVFDDHLCSIGTFNANPTSMGLANEVNVCVRDRAFVRRVAAQFERDRALCRPLSVERARARPLGEQVLDILANDAINLVDILVGPRSC